MSSFSRLSRSPTPLLSHPPLRIALHQRPCQPTNIRGAKMWVPAPQKVKAEQGTNGPLVDTLRLLKAAKLSSPELPITLTLEPALKKSVNANVLKGRFVLPHAPPPELGQPSDLKSKEVIALIVDQHSTADLQLGRSLGVDHVGGQSLIDQIVAGEINPTKLLCHTSQLPLILKNPATSKALGQRGLIPSEKRGTVSDDLQTLVNSAKTATDWALDPAKATISIRVGAVAMDLSALEQNIVSFVDRIAELAQTGKASTTNLLKNFKPGRPTKRAGIKKVVLSVEGAPQITVT